MSTRTITRGPGPNNPDGCPFCGAPLVGRVEVKRGTTTEPPERSEEGERNMGRVGHRPTTVVVVHCPNEGDLVLAADLIAALPTLSDHQRTATRDYLRALRGATDAPEDLDLTKVQLLAG